MADKITKDGDIVTITKTVVEKIDLKPLKDELASLEAEKMPSDKEVLEMAKQGFVHPYYDTYRTQRIEQIEQELTKWQ